jgi:hypothetical protein
LHWCQALSIALETRRARVRCSEREAKVLAALNHPDIAQIYGVALVMDLVEGEIRSRRVGPGAFEDV